MAQSRLKIHPMGLVVILFGFVAWVIALGGLGASMAFCTKANGYKDCAQLYQWEWWSLWFEAALLLTLFVCSFLEAYNKGKLVFIAYFAMCTVCLMLAAHDFINSGIASYQTGSGKAFKDLKTDAVNAAAAGFVLLSLTNFAILIVLGHEGSNGPAYQQTAGNYPMSAPV